MGCTIDGGFDKDLHRCVTPFSPCLLPNSIKQMVYKVLMPVLTMGVEHYRAKGKKVQGHHWCCKNYNIVVISSK